MSNRATSNKFFVLAFFLFLFAGLQAANGQTPAEIAAGSIPTVSGPTATPQAGRLLLNPSGTTYTTPLTNVTITATISNQQYTGSNTGTGNPVLMFGGTVNGSGTAPLVRNTYAAMNDIATPVNTQFSNNTGGTAAGIDVATNQAFNMFTSVAHWAGTSTPTNARYYMADLTFTFSTPLTNPLMHIVGIGGTYASGTTLGLTSELDLTTAGVTMTKVQGNTTLAVTGTQIKNNLATGMAASCSTNVAGCGTVKLNGTNIQSVTFKVYMRGDGGNASWGSGTNHTGDQWLVAFSVPETFTLSGNVFNDANGLSDGTVNGTGIGAPDGVQLYATLVAPATGKVIGSVPVNSDGTYSFNGIPAGANVRVEISTNQGTALANVPSRTLPAAWTYKGENIGAGAGNDGTADGAIAVTVNSNVTNVNFGINKTPTAVAVRLGGRVVTADGRPIFRARVLLADAYGDVIATQTNPFGYYWFKSIRAGETVIISVADKRYQFSNAPQVITVTEENTNINFVALPEIEEKTEENTEENASAKRAPFDFDGDGKTDYAVYRPKEGNWYILQSATSDLRVEKLGEAGDKIAPADFDGDGKTDFAVYNENTTIWTIVFNATGARETLQIGQPGAVAAPADYDGDGKADAAVIDGGRLQVIQSSNCELISRNMKHVSQNSPTADSNVISLNGDFDGDGKLDEATFFGGTWNVLESAGNQQRATFFGLSTDIPVPSAYLSKPE